MRLPIGFVYERLTVIEQLPRGKYRCRCICGTIVTQWPCNLRPLTLDGRPNANEVKSCGCLHREITATMAGRFRRTHGHGWIQTASGRFGKSPEYDAWEKAKQRCENPRNKKFPRYGGRGIRMCEAWRQNFAAFLAHIGPRPSPAYSLDRINNDGHYEPGNVRWATHIEQRRNRSNTHQTICAPRATAR
jgi:hypothetical protein